jgi:transposase
MDNLSVHRSKVVGKCMEDLDIKYIFNSPYSTETNPIEYAFSIMKRTFCALKTNQVVNGTQMTMLRMFEKSFTSIT